MFIRLTPLILLLISSVAVAKIWIPEPPEISAQSYILMDYDSGKILAEKKSNLNYEPASITKIMTAYVAYHSLAEGLVNIDDEVLVSTKAWKAEGSRTFIEANKKVPLLGIKNMR